MKASIFKIVVFGIGLVILFNNCKTTHESVHISDKEKDIFNIKEKDTIKISSDITEYDIIIIEPGFNFWLQSTAKQEGFYTQSYMETRNQVYVTEWNRRVLQPQVFNPSLYELQIDYRSNINYGYDVNYKLFNYFIYFQRKYNQRLGSFLPRI